MRLLNGGIYCSFECITYLRTAFAAPCRLCYVMFQFSFVYRYALNSLDFLFDTMGVQEHVIWGLERYLIG